MPVGGLVEVIEQTEAINLFEVMELEHVLLIKGEHIYAIFYELGCEKAVHGRLMDYAESDKSNLGWNDVLCAIYEMQQNEAA